MTGKTYGTLSRSLWAVNTLDSEGTWDATGTYECEKYKLTWSGNGDLPARNLCGSKNYFSFGTQLDLDQVTLHRQFFFTSGNPGIHWERVDKITNAKQSGDFEFHEQIYLALGDDYLKLTINPQDYIIHEGSVGPVENNELKSDCGYDGPLALTLKWTEMKPKYPPTSEIES